MNFTSQKSNFPFQNPIPDQFPQLPLQIYHKTPKLSFPTYKYPIIVYNNIEIIQKAMQLQSERTCDQSKQSSQQNVEDLRRRITLSNLELHGLIGNPEGFGLRIRELNRKAILEINGESYEEALIYLGEAEKNLEYAASCGLSLDRVLITTTLKNEACAYQRLWQLSTCYDYMQALLYNLNNCAEDSQSYSMTQDINDSSSEQNKKACKLFNQKLNLALCYLQFSALSSQLGKHEEARKSVEKSLELFGILQELCYRYEKISKGKVSQLLIQIKEILDFAPNAKISQLTKQCKSAIQKIKNYRYFFNFDSKLIQKLSMGDIMQINPSSTEQASRQTEIDWFVSQLGLISISIYISCCFFALATEIRLGLQKDIHDQVCIAKRYHLHSIRIASEVVLIESSFLNHIVKSFKNNFGVDLLSQLPVQEEEEEFAEMSMIQVKVKEGFQGKSSMEIGKFMVMHKRSDDQGTKVQTIQSQGNSNIDRSQKKLAESIHLPQRKVSVAQNFQSPKSKIPKSPKHLMPKQKTNPTMRTSRSHDSKKHQNESKSKNKNKNTSKNKTKMKKSNMFSAEYYNMKQKQRQQTKKSRSKDAKGLVSPKTKLTRKSESSQSRPKLKLKLLKSPPKP